MPVSRKRDEFLFDKAWARRQTASCKVLARTPYSEAGLATGSLDYGINILYTTENAYRAIGL